MLERFARLTLACIQRAYPYRPAHVVRDAGDLKAPRELHPAFYGCYDWHSAVHGHWLLAHLLRTSPATAQAGAIKQIFDLHFVPEHLAAEASYLAGHPGFERPYGWAWCLKLAHELAESDGADAARWRASLQPLVEIIEMHFLKWLPQQTYPIRSGTHTNTAFGLAFALDYAEGANRRSLKNLILKKSIEYYSRDRDYPAAWEPGGNDFLSPCLVEADLMRRVYSRKDFSQWFGRFLSKLPASLARPVKASDRSDGQLAHLDGLNLSRAACFFSLAAAMPEKKSFSSIGKRHLDAGLKGVASGHYAGEHWLATFAVHALSAARASAAAGSARAARS